MNLPSLIAPYRLYLELAAATALLGGFLWFRAHEQHLGREKCERAQAAAVWTQAAKDQVQHNSDLQTIAKLRGDYLDALNRPVTDAPVVRIVRVRDSAGRLHVPSACATAAGADAAPPDRASDTVDIGAPLVIAGRNADAQIAGLQRYIREICRP